MNGWNRTEAMGKVRDEVEREAEGEGEEEGEGWNWELGSSGARAGAPKGGIIRSEKAALS